MARRATVSIMAGALALLPLAASGCDDDRASPETSVTVPGEPGGGGGTGTGGGGGKGTGGGGGRGAGGGGGQGTGAGR
ncbi:MAG: hypothetical protein QOK40_1752 [Miltoncostaeaceae bacterium]|jgi:hypothetical protein|nr:hypothetical protein [Miltoncostaeaceae bacterium]